MYKPNVYRVNHQYFIEFLVIVSIGKLVLPQYIMWTKDDITYLVIINSHIMKRNKQIDKI